VSLMPLDDFIEHAHGVFRRWRSGGDPRAALIPDLSESHLFHLGDDVEFHKGVISIVGDLLEEVRHGISLPFMDTAFLSIVTNENPSFSADTVGGGPPCWTLDRVIENPPYWSSLFPVEDPACNGRIHDIETGSSVDVRPEDYPVRSRFVVARYQVSSDVKLPDPVLWGCYYRGVIGSGFFVDVTGEARFDPVPVHSPLRMAKLSPHEWLTYESTMILEQAAAVSHPMNYVVRESPLLTPREIRRREKTGETPDRKRDRYIVVDHEVLVGMSQGTFGTHESPIPHERRGHWRRLSERCTIAKRDGRTRTWVRPSYVGERTFSGPRARYEVLMDLKEATL